MYAFSPFLQCKLLQYLFVNLHKNCTKTVLQLYFYKKVNYTMPLFCSHHYFKYCKISALALLKMVMHARSGGNLEVMGLMLGKVDGETMIVMDSFALPVEGTETRVNAQAAAYEYMAAYIENAKQVRILFPKIWLLQVKSLIVLSF